MSSTPSLSVIIPARREIFLQRTIENILANIAGDVEIIIISDGCWPDPPLPDHPRVTVIHHTESIGQRAATNEGARISQAKFVMKLDAHCAVSKGFDVALMEDCRPDWTMVPMMYKLHAFNWKCLACNKETYQGYRPAKCKCGGVEFEMAMVWKRRHSPTVSWRFDSDLQFQYWKSHSKRPECQSDLIETMSCNGPCFFMHRERFWELGGCDEAHGSWGAYGTELACKAWLSGGKLMTTRKAWFAHLFRTGNFKGNGQSTWPYPITSKQIKRAQDYSRDLWRNGKWPKAIHPLSWLVEKFAPVRGWSDEDLKQQKQRETSHRESIA